MTTKVLTGTYSAGYTLSPRFSVLHITPSAYIGGIGVVASAPAEIANNGRILAGGGAAGVEGQGQGGGNGIDLAASGPVFNTNEVAGGYGGQGGYKGVNGYGGGTGGSGIILAAGGMVTNHGSIKGGDGGTGASSLYGIGLGGDGAAGGEGVQLGASGSVINGGLILGGRGGAGGYGSQEAGIYGGAGGAGVAFAASGMLTNNGGTIRGGYGGAAGNGYQYAGFAGRGGAGFSALASSTLINNGLIQGGHGGSGPGTTGGHIYYSGGLGGAGVTMNGGTILNGGTIVGGYSGLYGNGSRSFEGGDAIDSIYSPITLINDGLIQGGGPSYGYLGFGLQIGKALLTDGGSILNRGTMVGGLGILLFGAGTITNGDARDHSALIEGYTGIYIGVEVASSTVINFGTIKAVEHAGYYSVDFAGPGGVLIAESGARFIGPIAGGGGTFEVVGGANTITGLGGTGVLSGADSANFGGFGSYVLQGAVKLVGTNALASGQSLTDESTLLVRGAFDEAAGATITVAVGATLVFNGAGGVLAGTIGGAGKLSFIHDTDTLNGTNLTAANIAVEAANLTLEGTITNSGTVSVTTPTLMIGAGGATLTGGTWALSDNASNKVISLAASDTLNNASATISGAGIVGGGQMTLINRSAGVIDGNGRNALIIDTGVNRVANSGLIEAVGTGGVTIQSAVLNGGKLEANGGTLTVNGAVSGPGTGLIATGALVFNAAFSENVTFSGASGMLGLALSQGYAGSITGFSHTGGTSLDLKDIAFVSAGEATFNGTATSGVLTVTDGTHTAAIHLVGDYLGSTFIASNDGNGGTIVVDPPKGAEVAASHRFVAAMARFGARPMAAAHITGDYDGVRQAILAKPVITA